ncbi:hypothetical protein chiPu_0021668 [Chiloscyllium punctatum]|uniref:t-SNARE coiled-coil homology domain-containing protein n=1 Tax=Chiloscyllium punctatum TaxID=137246 RepID=A0A401RJU4_CHIPU|nr:hypothetical protein [Chiloscyllium punctatum]
MSPSAGGSVLLQDDARRSGDIAIDMDTKTSQQLQLIGEQDSYIQSRADTMQNIEATIVELGSIFQQLAHMVKEQEETIQRWAGVVGGDGEGVLWGMRPTSLFRSAAFPGRDSLPWMGE